ncbi:shieldin complex subunit 2 [Perognathus longimembris pacificus]|uniref:shieldin complex subunit 2 n=1 Tax=Perognathus longimembris pacificus TaxID=214514 RepID=UPI00201939DA|nr:shieldin complex subunit 2 [Perognathus longimembris pacificus]XP_048195161.1 shieldin complex subunit 2 [Perognathus longimembris pacificus]
MSRRPQVHIFWGAPVVPLNMTISEGTTSSKLTDAPWKEMQLLYNQDSFHLSENHELRDLRDSQIPEAGGLPSLLSGHLLETSVCRPVLWKEDCIHSTQNKKSQKSPSSGPSKKACGFKSMVQQLPEKEMFQELHCESKNVLGEQPKNQSNICGQNFQTNSFPLNHKCAAMLDLAYGSEQINLEPESTETKKVPTEHDELQNQLGTREEPWSEGTVRKASSPGVTPDTEFLSILTSSQVAFLAQRKDKGKEIINKSIINMQGKPKTVPGDVGTTITHLIQPNGFAEACETGQNQACARELLNHVCPETKSSHIHINPAKGLEENSGYEELFSSHNELRLNAIHIEPCSSGILCSQLNASPQTAVERSWTSEDKLDHPNALSKVLPVPKKRKLGSNAREAAGTVCQRNVSVFKNVKKISLIKNCDSKSQMYNCLVMVLAPCHVKEINIKSGPNSGSKVPLSTIIVIDQSQMKKRVALWRTAAFWALTVFLGDIILLTDVTVHEDQWVGETVLQSTFTSQLLNLGNYSSLQPEKYFSIVGSVVLQDLLAYVSSQHSYLRDLPPRRPQSMNTVEFVELEQLQPNVLVHALLRVVNVTILTEALYTYRGQKQKKIVLTVEQAQGQHYMLVLWGSGAAWCPQLQRKKDYIWEFKNLFVQRNCIGENLELHTTPWSACECLFDDDRRAVTFREKFQKSIPSLVKMSDLETHLKDKCSGVVLIRARILELVFLIPMAQKIVLNAHSSLENIFSSLPNIVFTGCAKCGLELETDENRIYRQCLNCLPFVGKKTYYRPALMTVVDGRDSVCIHVGSKLMEKILLNISPDCLCRVIVPSATVTFGMVSADLLHALLAVHADPCLLKIQSLFLSDENSFPLQQDFCLLDFCPDPCKAWSLGPA